MQSDYIHFQYCEDVLCHYLYTVCKRGKIIRGNPASHDFWLIVNFSTQNMRSPSNWTRFPGLWRRSNKFQLIVNFSKEFQLKVSDALVSCTLSWMHRKPLIWKVFSAFIRTPIKNSKRKLNIQRSSTLYLTLIPLLVYQSIFLSAVFIIETVQNK